MHGQTSIHLGDRYGLSSSSGKKLLKEQMTLSAAQMLMPDLFAYKRAQGWNDDATMALTFPAACAIDAVWGGHNVEFTKPCMSRTNVFIPAGDFYFNDPFPKCMGQYIGMGPHQGWHHAHAATTFHVDYTRWIGDKKKMAAMRATGYGITGNEGWLHGGYIDAIGFVGNRNGWHNPNFQEVGLQLWDEAEGASVGRIWASNFNGYGVEISRGTPQNWNGALSVFTNSLGGLLLADGALATVNINNVSGDDNGNALIVQRSLYGRLAGGMVNIAQIKSECGKRTPNTGQVVLYQMDPCSGIVTMQSVQADCNYVDVDAPFVMNTADDSWSMLNVGGFAGWNMRSIVHQIRKGKAGLRWDGASYKPEAFIWSSRNGGQLTDLIDLVKKPAITVGSYQRRIGFVPVGAAFDYANGLPVYDPTGGQTPIEPGPVEPQPPIDPEPPTAPDRDYVLSSSFATHSSYESLAEMLNDGPSRWTSGRVPTAADYIDIDLGSAKRWKTITLDATESPNDFVPGITVYVSTNGKTWSKLSASAMTGVFGAKTVLTSSTWRSIQYIRLMPTPSTKWWSIHRLVVE